MAKILVATQKPFAPVAKEQIAAEAAVAGCEVAFLEKYASEDDLCEAVAGYDALIVRSDIVSGKTAESADRLKVVVRAGAGYDNLDLDTLKAHGIAAMNTPGQNANGVAELAIAMLIFMSRNCFTPGSGLEIEGRTLGLHGFGAVARLVGAKAKALGMKVCAYDPFVTAEAMAAAGVEYKATLGELYGSSYAVSIHVPALPSTVGSVNAELLQSMNDGGKHIILNTARAEVVDEDAMFAAMQSNAKLCYASDVTKAEKFARFSEAFGARAWGNAVKIGAQTEESNTRAAGAAVRQIAAFLEHGENKFQLNK